MTISDNHFGRTGNAFVCNGLGIVSIETDAVNRSMLGGNGNLDHDARNNKREIYRRILQLEVNNNVIQGRPKIM